MFFFLKELFLILVNNKLSVPVGHERSILWWYLSMRSARDYKPRMQIDILNTHTQLSKHLLQSKYSNHLKIDTKVENAFVHFNTPFVDDFPKVHADLHVPMCPVYVHIQNLMDSYCFKHQYNPKTKWLKPIFYLWQCL